ncbi:MAG: hypothetical protein RL497_3087 [Pseudomonadota bacterium]|jgi:PhnB protein
MKTLSPYLIFFGRTAEALAFYQGVFNGEIICQLTFAEGGKACADNAHANAHAIDPSKIMHSEFRAENIHFFASDGAPGSTPTHGNGIMLSINFTSLDEQLAVYNALSAGGTIAQPLADQFWGAKYAEVRDQFGLYWSLNCFTSPTQTA